MKWQTILFVLIVILGFFLRFIDVSNNPPGLYIDEASIGYNAYTILTTGKDEYEVPHPLWFKSFGDYKLPAYIYSVAGTMSILGKTELAIRIPSILSGTLTIAVFYLFLSKLLSLEKDKALQKKLRYLPLLATFLLAISSWHIQFSRGGFEITMGTFFYLLGCYFYVFFKQNRSRKTIIASLFFFVLAVYTYHTFRVLSPLALLFIAYDQKMFKNRKLIPYLAFSLLLLLPVIFFSLSANGSERFNATSAFPELEVKDTMQKFIIYPIDYLRNYLSFFSFDFLFSFGDGIGRHQIPNFGELYRWQLPFFLGGIFILLRQKKSLIKNATFLLFLSTPLAGAVAVPSPHALRSLPLVFPSIMLIAVGILFFVQHFQKYKYKLIVSLGICLIAFYEFFLYLHFYYIHYPLVNQLDWGSSYKQLVLTTGQMKKNYNHIIIDENLAQAPAYFNFYDHSVKYTTVPVTWSEPASWKNSKVLYLRPFYGERQPNGVIRNIYLQGPTQPIFAQLWKLK